MQRHKIVSLVLYYRYYRFFPDGTLLYRTSPATISKVIRVRDPILSLAKLELPFDRFSNHIHQKFLS